MEANNYSRKGYCFSFFFFILLLITPHTYSQNLGLNRDGNMNAISLAHDEESDPIHEEGRKWIGVAVSSLKSDHYTTRLDSIDKKTDLQRREVYSHVGGNLAGIMMPTSGGHFTNNDFLGRQLKTI